MSEKSDRRAIIAHTYSQWIGSLFGPWWVSIAAALIVATIIGLVNILLIALVGLVLLNTHLHINKKTSVDVGLLKDKLLAWWDKRPWEN